jgi:hypothetical protein
MLSAIGNASKSAQNHPKLPKFAKICPKTISLGNFEIPPKIQILMFLKAKSLCVEEARMHMLTVWIFNTIISGMSFLLSKKDLCW